MILTHTIMYLQSSLPPDLGMVLMVANGGLPHETFLGIYEICSCYCYSTTAAADPAEIHL